MIYSELFFIESVEKKKDFNQKTEFCYQMN